MVGVTDLFRTELGLLVELVGAARVYRPRDKNPKLNRMDTRIDIELDLNKRSSRAEP